MYEKQVVAKVIPQAFVPFAGSNATKQVNYPSSINDRFQIAR